MTTDSAEDLRLKEKEAERSKFQRREGPKAPADDRPQPPNPTPVLVKRHSQQQYQPPKPFCVGMATWNCAHFGDGPIEPWKFVAEVLSYDPKKNELLSPKSLLDTLAACSASFHDFRKWEGIFKSTKPHAKLVEIARAMLGEIAGGDDDDDEEEDAEDEVSESSGEAADTRALEGQLADLHGQQLRDLASCWSGKKDWKDWFSDSWAIYATCHEQFCKVWEKATTPGHVLAQLMDCHETVRALRRAAKLLTRPTAQLYRYRTLAKKCVKAWKAQQKKPSAPHDAAERALDVLDASLKKWGLMRVLEAVTDLERAMHRMLIIEGAVRLFKQNPWLDILLLHEVNAGVRGLASALEKNGLGVVKGPHMKSSGGSKHGQSEYYPLVYRLDRVKPIDFRWQGLGGMKGRGALHESPDIPWKKPKTFRPVVVYQLALRDNSIVHAGIVHTTPGGSEFERAKVFTQLADESDEVLSALRGTVPIDEYLMVGGDFYLTAEAAALTWSQLDKETRGKIQQEINQRVAAMEKQEESVQTALVKTFMAIRAYEEDPTTWERDKAKIGALHKELDALRAELKRVRRDVPRAVASIRADRIQVLRNSPLLPEPISVAQRLAKIGYSVHQPVAATNPKTKTVQSSEQMQIADFFIADTRRVESSDVETKSVLPVDRRMAQASLAQKCNLCVTGLMSSNDGLALVDKEDLVHARFWRCFSDHFPVGAIFAKTPHTEAQLRERVKEGMLLDLWTAKGLFDAKEIILGKRGSLS